MANSGDGAEAAAPAPPPPPPPSAERSEAAAVVAAHAALRAELRRENTEGVCPVDKKKLKADLKKSSAFVKRVKHLVSDTDIEWTLSQIAVLNLNRYTSEVAQALVQAVCDSKEDWGAGAVAASAADCDGDDGDANHPYARSASGRSEGIIGGVGGKYPLGWLHIASAMHRTYDQFCGELAAEVAKALEGDWDIGDKKRTKVFLAMFMESEVLGLRGVDPKGSLIKKILMSLMKVSAAAAEKEKAAAEKEKAAAEAAKEKEKAGGEAAAPAEKEKEKEKEKGEKDEAAFTSVPVLPTSLAAVSFLTVLIRRYGGEYFGFGGFDGTLSTDDRDKFEKGFQRFIEKIALKAYDALLADSIRCAQACSEVVMHRGELPEEKKAIFEKKREDVRSMREAILSLARLFGDEAVAKVPEPSPEIELTSGETATTISFQSGLASYYAPVEDFSGGTVFDDEDERAFYEDLPDLAAELPVWATSASERKAVFRRVKAKNNPAAVAAAAAAASPQPTASEGSAGGDDAAAEKPPAEKKVSFDAAAKEGSAAAPSAEASAAAAAAAARADEGRKKRLDELLRGMHSACQTRLRTDEWVTSYVKVAYGVEDRPRKESEGEGEEEEEEEEDDAPPLDDEQIVQTLTFAGVARQRLGKAVFEVQRTAHSSFPFYARVAAVAGDVWRELGPNVVGLFETEFTSTLGLLGEDKAGRLEERRRSTKMLCELGKMGVCPAPTLLRCFASLLDAFSSANNVDVTVHLLQTAGRFLARSPASTHRFGNLLGLMKRHRANPNFTILPQLELQLDEALHDALTPVHSGGAGAATRKQMQIKKHYPPEYYYLMKLMYTESGMTKTKIPRIVNVVRTFPWGCGDAARVRQLTWSVCRNLKKVRKVRFESLPLIVTVVERISAYYPHIRTTLLDMLLEDIRVGLEICTPSGEGTQPISAQKRVLVVQYLSLLYANGAGVVEDSLYFEVLYTILFYAGFNDPKGYYFRVRLALSALSTPGVLQKVASTRQGVRHLHRFVPYLYYYVHCKAHPFPVDLDYLLADFLESLTALSDELQDAYQRKKRALQKLKKDGKGKGDKKKQHALLVDGLAELRAMPLVKPKRLAFPKKLEQAASVVHRLEQVFSGAVTAADAKLDGVGGVNPALLSFIRNLMYAVGNPSYLADPLAAEAAKATAAAAAAGSDRPAGDAHRKNLTAHALTNSIVPFRTKVHPIAASSVGAGVGDDDEDSAEEKAGGRDDDEVSDCSSLADDSEDEAAEARANSSGAGCASSGVAARGRRSGDDDDDDDSDDEEDEEEDEEKPVEKPADDVQEYDRRGGHFLIPSMRGIVRRRPGAAGGGAGGDEDGMDSFDSLFASAVKSSLDNARKFSEEKNLKKGSEKLDEKIAHNMNLPLQQLMRKQQQRQQQQPTSSPAAAAPAQQDAPSGEDKDEAAEASPAPASVPLAMRSFAIVQRKKGANTDGVVDASALKLAGGKNVTVGVLQVPTAANFGHDHAAYKRQQESEEEGARLRTLILQRQSQVEEDLGPYVHDAKNKRKKGTTRVV